MNGIDGVIGAVATGGLRPSSPSLLGSTRRFLAFLLAVPFLRLVPSHRVYEPEEFLGAVPHRLVVVGQILQAEISAMLVAVDDAAVRHMVVDLPLHHVRVRRRHRHRDDLPLALAHSQNWLLAHRTPTSCELLGRVLFGFLAPHALLVGLDHSRKKELLVAAGLLDAMEHVPGRLLRPIQLLGELQRGNALARHADLVHDPQPLPNGNLGRFHDGAHLAGELLATVLAVVVVFARPMGVGVHAPAFRAESALRPAPGLEEPDGVVLVADPFQKLHLSHRGVVRHGLLLPLRVCLF